MEPTSCSQIRKPHLYDTVGRLNPTLRGLEVFPTVSPPRVSTSLPFQSMWLIPGGSSSRTQTQKPSLTTPFETASTLSTSLRRVSLELSARVSPRRTSAPGGAGARRQASERAGGRGTGGDKKHRRRRESAVVFDPAPLQQSGSERARANVDCQVREDARGK